MNKIEQKNLSLIFKGAVKSTDGINNDYHLQVHWQIRMYLFSW